MVIPDIFYRESILLIASQKLLEDGIRRMCLLNENIHTLFCDAGVPPGSRAFAWGVPKGATIV